MLSYLVSSWCRAWRIDAFLKWLEWWGNIFGGQSYIIRLVGIQSQAWNHSEGTSRCDPKGVGNEALSASWEARKGNLGHELAVYIVGLFLGYRSYPNVRKVIAIDTRTIRHEAAIRTLTLPRWHIVLGWCHFTQKCRRKSKLYLLELTGDKDKAPSFRWGESPCSRPDWWQAVQSGAKRKRKVLLTELAQLPLCPVANPSG